MPEVLTCDCGGQNWEIRGIMIRCRSCNREYDFLILAGFDVRFMNDRIRKFDLTISPKPRPAQIYIYVEQLNKWPTGWTVIGGKVWRAGVM